MSSQNKTITQKDREEVLKLIDKSEKITVLGHHAPDPDCFSSIISLAFILKNLYKKEVDIVFHGKFTERVNSYAKSLGFNIESSKVSEERFRFNDLLFIIDVQDSLRTNPESKELDLSNFKNVAIIDHHPVDKRIDKYLSYRISRETVSTAELIFRLFQSDIEKLPEDRRQKVTEFLAYGIISDSKRFIIPQTSKETFEVIIDMIGFGADVSDISYKISSFPLEYYKFLGKLFEKIQIHKCGFGYMYLEDGDLPEDRDEADSLLDNFKHETQKVTDFDVFIMFQGKRKNPASHGSGKKYTYKIRTRSITTDMSKFNKTLGGGGHPQSGGSFVYANDDEEALKILAENYKEIVLENARKN